MAEEAHEKSTVNVRAVLISAAAIAAGVFISLFAAWGLLRAAGKPPSPPAGQPFTRVSGPPLEVTPREDLQRYRADERRKLAGYRLVDEHAGVVHIPIERAMALLAQEHGEADSRDEGDAPARYDAAARHEAAATRADAAKPSPATVATAGAAR